MTSIIPSWMMPRETETTITILDLPRLDVTIMCKVTGREVIPGIAFRSQPEPNWPIHLSLSSIVEQMLQDG